MKKVIAGCIDLMLEFDSASELDRYIADIRECVQPRDAIIHYDDIQVEYFFFEGHEIPKFICRKKQDVIEFSFQDVTLYISSFYAFYSEVTRMIFEKITNFAE